MSPSVQAQTVANQLISNAQSIMSVYNSQAQIDNLWNDQTVANYIANMATVSVNADGSLGGSDGSPNTSHPIPALSVPLSSLQISQLKTILDAIVSLVNGNAVSAQGSARAILDAAVTNIT